MPTRRSYSGAASAQALSADMTSVALTATLTSSTGWPNGTQGPFAVVLDRGTNSEEKVLCSGLTGNTLNIQQRGYDGTGAVAHSAPATVELCLTAIDLDEANAHTSSVSGVHGVNGTVVGTTDTQTLANKTLTSPTVTDWSLANHDHSSSAQGGLLSSGALISAMGGYIHTGSVSGSPASSFSIFPHGASFTPMTGTARIVSQTGFAGNVAAMVLGIDATNITVAFYAGSPLANVNLTTVTIAFSVFA